MKFEIKSAKNGYHSTQRTIYGRIPASEFYGFVLGVAIGWWYDQKYFMVKDEPEEGAESAEVSAAEKPAEPEVIEGASTQDTLKAMFARNADDDGEEDAE